MTQSNSDVIDLLTVGQCDAEFIGVNLTVGGKFVQYRIRRGTAASGIGRLAEALAEGMAFPPR
jgi:hypothetical protein